jgi:hypothetical protein
VGRGLWAVGRRGRGRLLVLRDGILFDGLGHVDWLMLGRVRHILALEWWRWCFFSVQRHHSECIRASLW